MDGIKKIKKTLYPVVKYFKDRRLVKNWQKNIRNKKNRRCLVLFQTPCHTNIGDHAITEAEISFISKYFGNDCFIEVNQEVYPVFIKALKGKLKKQDVILLHGGGNMGDQYPYEEFIRREIVKAFPNNKIMIFPQTVFYKYGEKSRLYLETKEIFAMHRDLILIARESKSFELMRYYFPTNTVFLTPDIVLSLERIYPKLIRKGALMVLRNDDERVLDDNMHKHLEDTVKIFYNDLVYSDMHHTTRITDDLSRKDVLNNKINQFKSAEIVITDRLHGMVFAAITQTPCIAFSNYNQKVSGTFEWINGLNYIKFLPVDGDVEQAIIELQSLETLSEFENSVYDKYYLQIIETINK